jgi:SAM-dependent methyltransferase
LTLASAPVDPAAMADMFADGDAYEAFMGRWSRPMGAEFVAWLAPPPHLRWVDVGCGAGALTAAALAAAAPAHVLAVDPSVHFAAAARRDVAGAPVEVAIADAAALPADDESADVVVSGLVLNFVPDASAALREQVRVTRPGGTVAGFVWDYAEGMRSLRTFWDAAAALEPASEAFDESRRYLLCRPDALRAEWLGAGLADVTVVPLEVRGRFSSADEVWTPFLGGVGPAGRYVGGLGDDERSRLADEFRRRLPAGPDGSVELTARAWAVRGTRP